MNRYSFSGKGNILIRASSIGKYGTKTYSANEPIAYFTDVLVDLSFSNDEKISRQGITNLTASSKSEPSFLSISNIKTNDSLQSLLYQKQENKVNHKTEISVLSSEGGTLYLPIQSGDTLLTDLFVYKNDDKTLVTSYTVDYVNGIISGLVDGKYYIFYSIDRVAKATYTLNSPLTPYVSLEINILGNINGATGHFVIHINKAKLLSRPELDFNSDSPFVDSLDFILIEDKEPIEVNYY